MRIFHQVLSRAARSMLIMIAIKFNNGKVESWKYPCEDLSELVPSNEGFSLYNWNGEWDDILYLQCIDGQLIVDENSKQADIQREQCLKEIREITYWFEDYDKKVSEHLRCKRLGMSCHHDINALDFEAERKRLRLAELRNCR